MKISELFNPVPSDITNNIKLLPNLRHRIGDLRINSVDTPMEETPECDIAIIGVSEDRNSNNKGCGLAPNKIRNQLYQLYKPYPIINIADLGNYKIGNTVRDTYIGLSEVILELLNNNIIPLIIGGTNDLIYSKYLAYNQLNKKFNVTLIDSRIDFDNTLDFNSLTYLNKIINESDTNLLHLTCLGYQSYFVSLQTIEVFEQQFFDAIRLGILRSNIAETEPFLRDADLIGFDISSIRQADAPANANPSPNGLTANEACQLSRYAGLSDRLTAFGVYEMNPLLDKNNQSELLVAQILWYFIDGFYNRKQDFPASNIELGTKFIVNMNQINHDMVFYKSTKTDRWWLELPNSKIKDADNLIISCSYSDYQKACNQEIPERWWKAYQKIS